MPDLIPTIVGTCFDILLFIYFLKNEKFRWGKVNVVLGFIACSCLSIVINKSSFHFLVILFCKFILLAGWARTMYVKIDWLNVIHVVLIFSLILGTSEILILPIIMLITGIYDIDLFYDNTFIWFFSYVSSKLLSLVLIRLMGKLKDGKELKMSKSEVLIEYTPLVSAFIIFVFFANFLVDIENVKYSDIMAPFAMVSVFLFLLTYTHINVFQHYMKIKQKEHEYEVLTEKAKYKYELYKNKSEKLKQLEIIQHDIKNHILVAQGEIQTEYCNKLLLYIERECSSGFDTGNEIIDILLEEKYKDAISKSIDMDICIEKNVLNGFCDMDGCSLFGNLLDNAIEACQNATVHKPTLKMNLKKINGFMVLVIENDFDEKKIRLKKGVFYTTKRKDTKGKHGIGTKSIQLIVNKYDGECKYEINNNRFVAKILLPISNWNSEEVSRA